MSDPAPAELKYPKQVSLIFVNEFCERFCYYGLRTILVLYIRNILLHSEATSKIIYHSFSSLAYAFPLLGAIVADSWFGKFRTIVYFSIVYVIGTLVLALSSVTSIGLSNANASVFCIIGLVFIAMGTGGIKPCVSSFGGDQFILPQQQKHLDTFFYFFYFVINLGSTGATIVTPLLRDLHCLGEKSCYPSGFGLPAVLMAIAIIVFVLGRPLYIMVSLEINVVYQWLKCILIGIKGKITSKEKVEHWLNHSEEKFGKVFVQHVKETLHVLVIFIPIPFFWALFDQTGSGWTLQANLMYSELGNGITILPEQMITVNSALILILIPLFTFAVYPLCAKCHFITTPLQRMTCGGICAGIGFLITAFVSLSLEAEAPAIPKSGESHILIYNPLDCAAKLDAPPYVKNLEIKPMDCEKLKVTDVKGQNSVKYTITGCNMNGTNFTVNEKDTLGYFLSTKGLIQFQVDVKKHLQGFPKIRTLVGNPAANVEITYWHQDKKVLEFKADNYSIFTLDPATYKLGDSSEKITLGRGGVYTILVFLENDKIKNLKVCPITQPNALHILWQLPQYFFLTVGEVLLSPTGLEFAYTQAPLSMKSVMTAMWLLTTTIGNALVVVVESLHQFENQSNGFFLYSGLMFLDMAIFAFLATRYTYVEQKNE